MERDYNLINIKLLKHTGDRYIKTATEKITFHEKELFLVYVATPKTEDAHRTLNYSLILLP